MSLSALNAALSGLKITQSSISVLSSNIANVNTVGYSRKVLQQSTQVIGGQNIGVLAQNIERVVDKFLRREVLDQIGVASGLETRSKYLQQIQEFHGPAEKQYALSNQVGKLKAAFQNLAGDPSQSHLLENVYQESVATVDKFHKFSDLITRLRNNAQDEMNQIVMHINALTDQIAELNKQVKAEFLGGRSTAEIEDQRDLAIQKLAEYIDISYYERSDDKIIVIQTRYGTPLVDDAKRELYFNPSTIGATLSYPASVAAIRVSDPVTGVNLTDQSNLGGQLGALAQLRDATLPQYQAQLDEMAYRMAERFNSQGLRLFSLGNQTIPADDPTLDPPSGYAGFARSMQVTPAVTNNHELIRSGTNGNVVPAGSAELLRKIVDFTFGENAYQQALGNIDLSGGVSAYVQGTVNIQNLTTLDTDPNINPGSNDVFSIQLGTGPVINITIGSGDTAADLVNTINVAFPGLASLNGGGRLVLAANDDITIADINLGAAGLAALGLASGTVNLPDPDTLFHSLGLTSQARMVSQTNIQSLGDLSNGEFIQATLRDTFTLTVGDFTPVNITIGLGDTAADLVNTINAAFPGLAQLGGSGNLVLTSTEAIDIADVNLGPNALAELGLSIGTTNPVLPSFSIQLGNKPPVTIDIGSSDTSATLLASINAIAGITATLTSPDGYLQITPDEGGDLILVDGFGNPLQAMGIQVTNVQHTAFRTTGLSSNGLLSSGIGSATNLVNYITQAITKQSQDAAHTESSLIVEQTYRDTLVRRQQDENGVNLDEEMALLVQLQNNYAAAAKAIQVIDEMFAQLMAVIR